MIINYSNNDDIYEVCIVRIDWPDPCLETLVSKLTILSIVTTINDDHNNKIITMI